MAGLQFLDMQLTVRSFFRGFEHFNLLNFSHLYDPIDLWES